MGINTTSAALFVNLYNNKMLNGSCRKSSCCMRVLYRVEKEVPTFLSLPRNFSMSNPCFLRQCFECQAPDQLVVIKFHR